VALAAIKGKQLLANAPDAFGKAIKQHGAPEIFNTDQDSQFTSEAFTGMLKQHDICISMDGKDHWVDNVFVERLWRSVKAYDNLGGPRASLGNYFEFYNSERHHQSLWAGGHRITCIMKRPPGRQHKPRKHLSYCPIFGAHYSSLSGFSALEGSHCEPPPADLVHPPDPHTAPAARPTTPLPLVVSGAWRRCAADRSVDHQCLLATQRQLRYLYLWWHTPLLFISWAKPISTGYAAFFNQRCTPDSSIARALPDHGIHQI
jgi:hypothetical protein